jgi:hypothetical protein
LAQVQRLLISIQRNKRFWKHTSWRFAWPSDEAIRARRNVNDDLPLCFHDASPVGKTDVTRLETAGEALLTLPLVGS